MRACGRSQEPAPVEWLTPAHHLSSLDSFASSIIFSTSRAASKALSKQRAEPEGPARAPKGEELHLAMTLTLVAGQALPAVAMALDVVTGGLFLRLPVLLLLSLCHPWFPFPDGTALAVPLEHFYARSRIPAVG